MEPMAFKRLGLDLDGTLADHTVAKIRLAEEFGYDLGPRDTSSKQLRARMPAEVYEEFRNRLYRDHVESSPRAEGCYEALTAVIENGWGLIVISRRYEDNQEGAREWVQRELGGLIQDREIMFVPDDNGKDTAAAVYGIAAYVDDQAKTLRLMGSVQHKILFDPFDEGPEEGIMRMRRWNELPNLLNHLFGPGTPGM